MADSYSLVYDDSSIKALLKRLAEAGSDMQPLMANIGKRMQRLVLGEFDKSQDPYGKVWEVLHYKRESPSRGPGDPPLVDTGELRDSFFFQATANELIFGTRDPKAPTHQDGLDNVFERLMMPTEEKGLPAEWEDMITIETTNYLLKSSG